MDTNIEIIYRAFEDSNGVCTDTRKLRLGDVFVALKGPNFNGNNYARQAIEEGATYVVVDEPQDGMTDRCFLVEDALLTLQNLANYHRKQFDIPVFALTGSNGKTTTKELIQAVLSTSFEVLSTEGNLNNHIGVPLTLLRMNKTHKVAIIEMGANHLGEINALCKIAEPTHGLITNIGTAHIGTFGGQENIIRGKSELYDHLRQNEGQVFINQQDNVLLNMSKRFTNAITYPNAHFKCWVENGFVQFSFRGNSVKTQLTGAYNSVNIAAALTVGDYFGVDPTIGCDVISKFVPANNRSQLLMLGDLSIILDAYNANPTSMKLALDNLGLLSGDKYAILGDMNELGEFSDDWHQQIVEHAESLRLKELLLCGERMMSTITSNKNTIKFLNAEQLSIYVEELDMKEGYLLIKGSRNMALEKIVGILKNVV